MRCLEHNQETNYLSIFDPRTMRFFDHFYKNLHEHFGDRIDGVYACILGPYGEGQTWAHTSKIIRVAPLTQKEKWPLEIAAHLGGLKGFEGRLDGFWTSRRGPEVFVFNANENAAETKIDGELVRVAPYTIYSRTLEK